MVEQLMSLASQAAIVIGIMVFIVSVITQVTKGWGFLDRIPTKIQVYVTSLVLCCIGLAVYISYSKAAFIWYYIVVAIILSFFVSLVATDGWDALSELWKRSQKKED